ncbi:Heat-inducible transcription repressor HrcA [Chlamydiales bacterium SCGC AG-110-M15]|nr:Heat-inducible transcription repressor HrcA [Chlamydiales bacterium SCGC AG-110-M15]
MKPLKTVPSKRSDKKERELQVLLGLVDLYIKTGSAVGSTTLREKGFQSLSSATIRNYFVILEKQGYLEQQHSSAGRLPTAAAFELYAQANLSYDKVPPSIEKSLASLREGSKHEVSRFLQRSAELLSEESGFAVFLSAPRFDHDVIIDIKLIGIDLYRCLCVLVTDFGMIKTEVLHTEEKLTTFALKRIESYFHWRLTGCDEPTNLNDMELELAQRFYNEVMVRYIVGYSNFSDEDLYWTGFSQLLEQPEFSDALSVASGLALFENPSSMRHLLRDCSSSNQLKYWIGDKLKPFSPASKHCAVLAIPYCINQSPVGAVGILGPMRMPYRDLFATLRRFSQNISEALTRDIYKFKIEYRPAESGSLYLQKEESTLIQSSEPMLLEDKRQ